MIPQISFLLVASAVSLAFLRREVPRALANPCGFPAVRWGWPEKAFTAGLVVFFLAMAAAPAGRPTARIDMRSLGSSLVLYSALVLLVCGFLFFRNFSLRDSFGLAVRGWSWRAVAGWLAMSLPLVYFAQSLAYLIGGPDQSPQAIVDFLLKSSAWEARAAVFGIAVVAAPVTEELIFRGCLYGILRQSIGRTPAIAGSAVVFALIHGHLPSLPGLVVLAAGLAMVYERCGSLWAPISLHAAFNAITIIAAIAWPDFAK